VTDTADRVVAGRYAIEQVLGRGGAGVVWRGLDTVLDRPVAVKVFRQDLAAVEGIDSSLDRGRVLREARAAARLQHPGAVAVYDVVEVDDRLHLVMELVDAPDLATLVERDGPLPPAAAARIGLQLLDVLGAAHRLGIVHRDVKPSNVLVHADGRVRLTDFGTAVLTGEDRLTATGVVIGSPAYMAPEQAVGRDVGPAADRWSLGATLFHAVEGAPPFSGPSPVATMHAVLHEAPRPAVRAGVLAPALDRLLVRDPARRADAEETRALLRRAAARPRPLAAAAADAAPAAGQLIDVRDRAPSPEPTPQAPARPAPDGDGHRHGGEGPALVVGGGRRGVAAAAFGALAVAAVAAVLLGRAVGDRADAPGADPGALAGGTPAATAAADVPAGDVPVDDVPAADVPGDGVPAVDVPADSAAAADPAGSEAAAARPDAGAAAGGAVSAPAASTPGPDEAAAGQGRPAGQDRPGRAEDAADADDDDADDDADEGDGDAQALADGDWAARAEVPADWVRYEPDHAPYRVSHPQGWVIERLDATRTDVEDPDGPTYLRLDWTDDPAPDALADWESYEQSFAASHSGYERIRLERTTFRGEDAALWEYRYTSGGAVLHAYNLNVSGGEYGYALNFQSSEAAWEDVEPLFAALAASYEIG
jgi:eukaryotic-like serine/threonine-protein kinase